MKFLLPIVVGVSSHLSFCLYVFLVKDLGNHVGRYTAAFLAYAASVLIIGVLLLHPLGRKWFELALTEMKGLLGKAKTRRAQWCWITLLTAISLWSYYGGIASGSAASFTLLARTDAVFTFLLCVFLLREPMQRLQHIGAWLVMIAVVVVVCSDAFGLTTHQYFFGALFVTSTGAVAVLLRNVAREIGEGPLFILRMSMATILLVPPALIYPFDGPNSDYHPAFSILGRESLIAISGLVLAYLFLARFCAYRIGPLWMYSALAASQYVITPILAHYLVNQDYPRSTWYLLAIMIVGTVFMALPGGKLATASSRSSR